MKSFWVIVVLMVTLSLIPQGVMADCELHVKLSGCVQDIVTHKPLVGARIFYEDTEVSTDSRGCFLLEYQSEVAEGDFFPTNFCIIVYMPGYQVAVACRRRESLEPFPPCTGTSILNLSFSYSIVWMTELSTDVPDPDVTLPGGVELHQNFPNPFNPDTEIGFSLSEPANVRLEVFDVLGRQVAMLINDRMIAGSHRVRWIAQDSPAGVYFYRLRAGDQVQTKRMLLLK